MPLHTCQGCGEAWSHQFIAANRGSFEVDVESKAVTGCPNCHITDGALVTEDHDVTTDDVVQPELCVRRKLFERMEGRR